MIDLALVILYLLFGFSLTVLAEQKVANARMNNRGVTDAVFFLAMLLWPAIVIVGVGMALASMIKLWTKQ